MEYSATVQMHNSLTYSDSTESDNMIHTTHVSLPYLSVSLANCPMGLLDTSHVDARYPFNLSPSNTFTINGGIPPVDFNVASFTPMDE